MWCNNTKNSCLFTLPSASNDKKKKASFACVSLGGGVVCVYLFLFYLSFIDLFICFTKAFPVTSQQERLKDITGCNLQLALTLAVLLSRPRTRKAIVKVPINLLDEFTFHMSLKWMLPWWLADPTNCHCSPVPLPIPYGLPPPPPCPPPPLPPLALLPFSTWNSREWGFVSSGPMSHVKDAWSEPLHPCPRPQSRFTNNLLPSALCCSVTEHTFYHLYQHAHCLNINIPIWPRVTMTYDSAYSPTVPSRSKLTSSPRHWPWPHTLRKEFVILTISNN